MSSANNRNQLVLIGLLVVVVLGLFGYLALRVGSVRTSEGLVVDAIFEDAQGLIENGSVRIAGIKVGSIGELKVDGHQARVTIHLDEGVEVRNDVQATIKAKSLLGEKFIELIPGSESAPLLKSGDVITNTFVPAELPDLASQIGPLLSKIDPEDVGRMVKVISRVLEKNENEIPQIVESLGRITYNVDSMLTRNGPKIDKIIDVTENTLSTSGPKINRLVDSTQRAIDNTNALLETNGPRLDKFTEGLSKIEMEKINGVLNDVPETFGQAKEVVTKVNKLLDGFEGMTYADLEHLMRDQGIHVRMMERSEEEQAEARKRWEPKTKAVSADAKP